jgi:hypothetical protein
VILGTSIDNGGGDPRTPTRVRPVLANNPKQQATYGIRHCKLCLLFLSQLERSAPDMAPLHPIRCTAPDVAAPTSGAPDMTTESGAVTGSGAQRTGYGTTAPDPVHRTGCGSSHIRCTGYDYHIRCTGSDTVISGARHRIKPISGALDLAWRVQSELLKST